MPKSENVIHIDRAQFKVPSDSMTGAQIRLLPTPPVSGDRDLWLEAKGGQPDRLIADADIVPMENGLHFFTAPREITPGTPA